jgi:hypothetical protein
VSNPGANAVVRPPHFIQSLGHPVFVGQGTGELTCCCGESVLVKGYDPRNFLAVDFQCAHCGAITTTPGLAALETPPGSVVGLDRTGETKAEATAIPPGAVLAGRDEIDRLMALYQPRTPPTDEMTVTDALLQSVAADYDRLTGGHFADHLSEVVAAGTAPKPGLGRFPLAWAIQTLRTSIDDPDWSCSRNDAASVATALVGAFRHFNDCWSHHPLFPMMAATAADTGFSFHGLALFATAKSLSDSGNRVGFLLPRDGSDRVREFTIAVGPQEHMACVVDTFATFEWPGGRPWDFAILRAAVLDRLLASKARINVKRPGMVILSPGATNYAMEQPLVDAIISALQSYGRRYRGVAAMSVILAKIVATAERTTVRFGYSFYPITNPRHMGSAAVRVGARGDLGG